VNFLCVFGLTFQPPDIFSIPVETEVIMEEKYKRRDGYYHIYGNMMEIGT
jgi:hypothetical protein